jgi:hypothetical protein
VGTAYNATISAGGGSGTLSLTTTLTSNELPAGLSVTNSNGQLTINGTPTATGNVSFSVTAKDTAGDTPVTQNYTLTVNSAGAAPVFTTSASAIFTAGQGGFFSVGATGSPMPSFTLSGTLPRGVNFTNNGNGTASLSGTPAVGTQGTYSFAITANNGVGSSTQDFTLIVNPAPISQPPPPPPPQQPNPPSVPSLLGFLNSFLGAVEAVNSQGTTFTASFFGFPLLTEIYDFSGHLVSAQPFRRLHAGGAREKAIHAGEKVSGHAPSRQNRRQHSCDFL